MRIDGQTPQEIIGKIIVPLLSREQAFLDRPIVGWALDMAPPSKRRRLAIRFLGLSPHFSYKPFGAESMEALEREFDRNVVSRRQIHEKLIRPYLDSSMRVLDFGCGPGHLAKAVSTDVAEVIALDVSRGVIACAKVLNNAPNITYRVNQSPDLRSIPDSTIDFVYSIAVIQHLDKRLSAAFFREFFRVLKPGGKGLCHLVIGEGAETEAPDLSTWEKWLKLRMVLFSADEAKAMAENAKFDKFRIVPVADLAQIDDDVGHQHVVIFEKSR